MKRLSKISLLVTMGGALGLGASAGCGTHNAGADVGPGIDGLVFAKRMHTTVSGDAVTIEISRSEPGHRLQPLHPGAACTCSPGTSGRPAQEPHGRFPPSGHLGPRPVVRRSRSRLLDEARFR